MTAGVEYDVRLTAEHEAELEAVAREELRDSGGQDKFVRGVHYSANWKRTPKASEVATAAERLRSDLQKNLAHRVVPARTLTAFPLSEALSNVERGISVDLAQMQKTGRFTLLRLVLHADAVEGEALKYLAFRLTLPSNRGVLTWAMWPTTKLTLVASAGATVGVALNSRFGFEIPTVPVHPGVLLGAGVKSDVSGNFLLIREWRRYRADIVATGQQDSFADWRLKKPRDIIGDVEFMWVVFSPNGVTGLSVGFQGLYKIKPGLLKKTVSVGMKKATPYKVTFPA
ncbi:MAG TPA: hypothetical protein VGF91_23745 [Solirubrobacteraceae bacterium]|jgi:hypothetical protein